MSPASSDAASFEETLAKLAARAAGDPETARFTPGQPAPAAAELVATEARLDEAYPPSFRELVSKHGLFAVGDPGSRDRGIHLWPLDEHRSALARAADELDCEAEAEAVAEQLGLPVETIAVLGEIILIGSDGHEDFIGFDLRTRNPKTGECEFTLQLMDDLEIEYLANKEAEPCEGRGFDTWLATHIQRRYLE